MLVVLSRTTHSKTNLLGAPAVFECMHACAGAGVSYYYNSSSVLLHKTYVDFQRQAGETSAIEIQKHASKSSLSLSVYIALIDIYIYICREREREAHPLHLLQYIAGKEVRRLEVSAASTAPSYLGRGL